MTRTTVLRSVFGPRFSAMVLVCLVCGVTMPAGAEPSPIQDLGSYIGRALGEWQVPGLAIAVVKDDEVVFSEGFGVRHIGEGTPVDANTLFAIASNTKAFTATALGLLVQDGMISWDDPVLEYLPEFQMYDPVVTRKMTVRDLLCHRSGLGRWAGDLASFGSTHDRQELIWKLRYQEPAFDFRTSFGYSNLMFLVAGEVVPRVTGMSWDDFVRERIFLPLGMGRSNTTVRDLGRRGNVATPHTWVEDEAVPVEYNNVDNHGPAGAVNSSVNDMAEWLRLQLGQGSHNGEQLVDSSIIAETRKPHTLIELDEEARALNPWTHLAAYGLGWVLADYEGRLVVYHTGGLDGMYSYTGFMPEENLGVVVLTNRDRHNLMRAAAYHVYDAYLGVEFRDWSRRYQEAQRTRVREREEEKRERDDARVAGTVPTHSPGDYAGRYESAVYGKAEVRYDGVQLTLLPGAHPRITGVLQHWHYDTFLCAWTDPVWDESLVHFDLSDDGEIARFRMKVRPDWIDTREYTFVRR